MLDTREELVWVNNVMSLQLLLNAVCPDAIPWTVALLYIWLLGGKCKCSIGSFLIKILKGECSRLNVKSNFGQRLAELA